MPRSYVSAVVPAPADAVWAYLRDFNGVPRFVEAIAASEIVGGKPADQVGCERLLTLGDGNPVRETLVSFSDLDRTYTYHLTEGPFPWTRYYSTIRVYRVTADDHSFVEWWSVYDCAEADEKANDDLLVNALFGPGLAAVRAHFAGA